MGRELTPCAIEAVHTDPIVFIIGRNVHRRHLTKQEQADYLVKGLRLKEAEAAKADDFSRHDGEKIAVRGRKPDRLKAKAVAAGKELDIGKRTIERALAEPGSKKPKPKPRRSRVEKERELFIRFLHQIGDGWEIIPEPSDAVLDGLTKDQNASGIETLETGVGRLARTRKRMQERYITDK